MRFAINILNWNGYKDTVDCISSILKNEYGDFQIFVLDNGSKNREYSLLKKKFIKNKRVSILSSKRNLGFAQGHNYLCSKINIDNFDYVFLLNNDTLLKFNFLKEMDKSLNKINDKRFKIFVPTIYYFNKKLKEEKIWRANDSKKLSQYEMAVKRPTGCAVIIESDIIKKYGLFKEEFFAYAEELEYFYRMNKLDVKILYIPKAIMWHKVIEFKDSNFKVYMSSRNKWHYWSLMNSFDKIAYLLYLTGWYLPLKFGSYSKNRSNLHYFFKGNKDGIYWSFTKIKPKNPFIKNE